MSLWLLNCSVVASLAEPCAGVKTIGLVADLAAAGDSRVMNDQLCAGGYGNLFFFGNDYEVV